LEDVLRLAASRAAHSGRAAGIDDVVQALGEVGGDRPGGDLVVRHFPRSREFWGSLGSTRSDGDRPLTLGGAPGASPGVDQAVVQRLFERLSDLERGFADRLAALESVVARHSAPTHTDLSPLDSRLSAIESALHSRANGDAGLVFDAGFAGRLATIEEALATERAERASAITALSDEISGVRSAVRLAAQNSDTAQAALAEQLQLIASSLDQSRDAGGNFSDRIAAIEQSLEAQSQRLSEAQAVYSAELAEVHDALMKIGANHQTLAGAIDNWRSNDSGEIHLINARIGAVHEDGAKRLAAIEKLCSDVETLSHLVIDDRTRPRGNFKRWLLGTEDWVKASWRPPSIPKPSRPKWTRVSWRLPFSKKRGGNVGNG
jgi:hypothetical protein